MRAEEAIAGAPPAESGDSGEWIAFDRGGAIAVERAASFSEKSARLLSGEKIPSKHLWMRGLPPPTPALLAAAERLAAGLGTADVWRAAAGRRLSPADLGAAALGAAETAEEGAARSLAALRAALAEPFYFDRADGMLTPRPADVLEKILESRRRREERRGEEEALAAELAAGRTPPAVTAAAAELPHSPDKESPVYRALKKHAGGDGDAFARFFIAAGILPDARAYFGEMFRRAWPTPPRETTTAMDAPPPMFSRAPECAFSIDEAGTVEIDDAFSIVDLPNGDWRVGVHIAAPALCGATLSAGRRRLISVYFPDEKHCMLPAGQIAAYSLRAGEERPALSLYLDYSPATGAWRAIDTRLEMARLRAALSPSQVDAGDMPAETAAAYEKLRLVADAIGAGRGDGGDYGRDEPDFKVVANPPAVETRRRDGAARVVAVLMRTVNGVWGERLTAAGVGGLRRADGATRPAKDGSPYMWLSSPLRRHVDLANQRLLLSLMGVCPSPREKWRDLAAAFDRRHARARHFQRLMERHWALRALSERADATAPLAARHLGEGRLRLADYPLVGLCAAAAALPEDADVLARVGDVDFVGQRLSLRLA